jgi:hypothetical protein
MPSAARRHSATRRPQQIAARRIHREAAEINAALATD